MVPEASEIIGEEFARQAVDDVILGQQHLISLLKKLRLVVNEIHISFSRL